MENECHIGKKTLWEKEKLLVTSNFSFSHNVFHIYISLVHQNASLCGNQLNIERKVKNVDYKHFLHFPQSFWKVSS